MRLLPDRAKRAILHPEKHAREAAVNYFAGCNSPDPDIIPLAIRAIEQYDVSAFETNTFFSNLFHSDETFCWMLTRRASLPDALPGSAPAAPTTPSCNGRA